MAALLLLAPTVSASAAPSTPTEASATRLLAEAVAAATGTGSVRVSVRFFNGKVTGEVVQDSAKHSAVQTVAIGKERMSTVLVGGTAYISGNASGLASYYGLPQSDASAMSGRWISVTSSDQGFSSIVSGLTLTSALKEVAPTRTLTEGKRSTILGKSTFSISGTASSGQSGVTLFVTTKGRHLPVEAVVSSTSGKGSSTGASGEIVTFSRWGEHVVPPKVTGAVPISLIPSVTQSGS